MFIFATVKLPSIIIVVLSACFLFKTECHAQNNPYKIKDRLYNYYKKIDANIQSDKALKMADTLFAMAGKDKDVKAQCLALYSKTRHFHVIRDFNNEIKEFHQVSPFILKTPYLQYYFGMWTNIILRYINDGNTSKSLNEIMAYRRQAKLLKSGYGTLQSYTLQADHYMKANHFRLAKEYYQLAYHYANEANITDVTNLLFDLSRCCFYLSDWHECKKYLDLVQLNNMRNSFSTRVYAARLSYDCNQIPIDSAIIEQDYSLLIKNQKEYPILKNDYFMYKEAMYYYYLYYQKDAKKAASYRSSRFYIPNYFDLMKKASLYESQKDYKEAASFYQQYVDCIRKMNNTDDQYLIDEFVPQLDFYNLEHEKNELRKRNESLKLQQLEKQRDILALTEQQNEGRLITNQRERCIISNQLVAQSESIEQQNKLLKIKKMQNEQRRKSTILAAEREKWQMRFVLILAIALFTILAFYTIEKLRKSRQLKSEKEKAEKSNYIKSLFFQNMNHEIRTPLNAISGFNDLLNSNMSDEMSTEEKKELINMITINSNLLTTLVNDVIDLSNFESGTYKLNFDDVDIDSVCNTAVESIRGQQKEGVRLSFETSDRQHPTLHTDAQRLQQVLTNYLTNACKHTDSGSIILSYDITPKLVRFSVTDTGCGVKKEDAEKVFERFEMLKTNRSGTGLGLHICRLIANLLHGKVYLDTAYKKGARFIFDHPIIMGLLLLFTLSLTPLPTMAKNKFGINDKLYSLYLQAENEYDPARGISIANKMYAMAVRMHDKRGQCIAVNSQNYFYVYANNEEKMLYTLNLCKRLSIAANYYNALYDSWVNTLSFYLMKNDTESAKKQLSDMAMMAKKHNDGYGFGAYYYEAGNYYLVQRQYAAAIFYYLQSLEYKNVDFNTVNTMTGQCYFAIGNYPKAVEYCEKALTYDHPEFTSILPLMVLETCYYKLDRPDKAKEVFDKLNKIDKNKIPSNMVKLYHSGLYTYYHFIAKDKQKEEEEEKLAHTDNAYYDHGQYLYDRGDYESACLQYKKAADQERTWLTSDYKDLNNFYIGKFDFKESSRGKEILELNAMNLKVKESQNDHQLLMLKHEKSLWLLHQDELLAKDKQGRLRLQKILLDKKRLEYQKQNLAEQGLIHQKEMMQSSLKWKTLTIAAASSFILIAIIFFIIHLRLREKSLMNDAEKAKQDEKKKALFYDSINHEIHEPIDAIIRLNHKLNVSEDNSSIPAAERRRDVEELDHKTTFLTDFINDVLVISKLESGTYTKQDEPCSIDVLCHQSLLALKSSRQIEYKSNTDRIDQHSFTSDGQMIQQIITSFLQYACNNSDASSPISITSVINDGILTLSVAYAGKQLSKEEAKSMFEYGTKREDIQGKGDISLYKTKLIAQMLDGQVYADTTVEDNRKLVFELPV
jgi:signal transduction histidine kinase